MRNLILSVIVCGLVAATTLFSSDERGKATMAQEAKSGDRMLAHNVYFTLKNNTPDEQKKLIAACHKYLKDHPGVEFFGTGPIVKELDRDVNVQDFQVGLHVVFKNKKYHDEYQTAATHLQFIAENKENWEQVRVFDTYLD